MNMFIDWQRFDKSLPMQWYQLIKSATLSEGEMREACPMLPREEDQAGSHLDGCMCDVHEGKLKNSARQTTQGPKKPIAIYDCENPSQSVV